MSTVAPRALHASSLLDPLRSLRQPLHHAVLDLALWIRHEQSRRRCLKAGDHEGALVSASRLIREVQMARESITTYRRIDAMLLAHQEELGHYRPGREMPMTMAVFVGQSRSGHSLVGSLIDAHPDAAIAHEIHAIKHLAAGVPFADLVQAIKLNARLFALLSRGYTGYDYQVGGQFQGHYRTLKVIGDKKGNGTTRLLRRNPKLLDWVDEQLPVPLRFINVIRSPFDNIATRSLRTGISLRQAASRFLANAKTLEMLNQVRGDRIKLVYLDELIASPREVLRDLVAWLGLSTDSPGYLDDCAAIVFERPRRTRHEVDWPADLVAAIRKELLSLPDLARFADEAV